MEIKTLNEIYKMSDDELFEYEDKLYVHHYMVSDELKRRMEKEGEGINTKIRPMGA